MRTSLKTSGKSHPGSGTNSPEVSPGRGMMRSGEGSTGDVTAFFKKMFSPRVKPPTLRERVQQLNDLLGNIDFSPCDAIFKKIFDDKAIYPTQHNNITIDQLINAKNEITKSLDGISGEIKKSRADQQLSKDTAIRILGADAFVRRLSVTLIPTTQRQIQLDGALAMIDEFLTDEKEKDAKKLTDFALLKLAYHWDDGIGGNSPLGVLCITAIKKIHDPSFELLFKCFEFYNNIFGGIKSTQKLCSEYERESAYLTEMKAEQKKGTDFASESEINKLEEKLARDGEIIPAKIEGICSTFAEKVGVFRESVDKEIQPLVNRSSAFSLIDHKNLRPDLELLRILDINEPIIQEIHDLVKAWPAPSNANIPIE